MSICEKQWQAANCKKYKKYANKQYKYGVCINRHKGKSLTIIADISLSLMFQRQVQDRVTT